MAQMAELDKDNKVIRVLEACPVDISENGGDQSESAATHFQSVAGLSANGVKYVQTSIDAAFRKNYAGLGFTYDESRDAFIPPKKHPSWILNETTCRYEPPVEAPEGNYVWNEDTQTWDAT